MCACSFKHCQTDVKYTLLQPDAALTILLAPHPPQAGTFWAPVSEASRIDLKRGFAMPLLLAPPASATNRGRQAEGLQAQGPSAAAARQPAARQPAARECHAAAAVGGALVVHGGTDSAR